MPQPSVDQELLTIADAGLMQQDRHAMFVDFAMISDRGGTGVVDFSVELFKVLGYANRSRLACTRMSLPLFICGETRRTRTDVYIVDRFRNDILLLVQEDKRLEHGESFNRRAQLVAEAVAAFNENNLSREELRLPPLAAKVRHSVSLSLLF